MNCRLLVLSLLLSIAQSQSCPSACNCTTRRADCVRVGIDAVSLNLDVSLKDYNFTLNKVGVLNKDYFSQLTNAEYLLLRSNGITEVDPKAFHHNSALERIDLAYNRIKYLPSSLLQSNLKLKEFSCEYNNLTSIDENLFDGLVNLEIITLENNQIMTISPKAFISNVMLQRLYLEYNQLETAYW